jgi:hypothetical protein
MRPAFPHSSKKAIFWRRHHFGEPLEESQIAHALFDVPKSIPIQTPAFESKFGAVVVEDEALIFQILGKTIEISVQHGGFISFDSCCFSPSPIDQLIMMGFGLDG